MTCCRQPDVGARRRRASCPPMPTTRDHHLGENRLSEDDLFADDDRRCRAVGWWAGGGAHSHAPALEARDGENAVSCTSAVPVHSAVAATEAGTRLLTADYAWLLRGTEYAAESASYFRLRPFVARGQNGFVELGVQTGTRTRPFARCPRRQWSAPTPTAPGASPADRCRGRITPPGGVFATIAAKRRARLPGDPRRRWLRGALGRR